MNNGWIGKGDGGGSRGRGRGRGDLTGVKPCKPAAKELEGVSDEKRSRSEVALLRVIKSKVEEEMEKEDKVKEELLVKNTLPLPKFAHICKTVRKKEERKNLKGFDCKLCEDYYQFHLDDGLGHDKVEEMKQKNSKHRGLFKPPSTPERFWDPEIVEDGPDDPRSKIIDAPPLKKRKGAKMFAVGEIVNGDEFDLE